MDCKRRVCKSLLKLQSDLLHCGSSTKPCPITWMDHENCFFAPSTAQCAQRQLPACMRAAPSQLGGAPQIHLWGTPGCTQSLMSSRCLLPEQTLSPNRVGLLRARAALSSTTTQVHCPKPSSPPLQGWKARVCWNLSVRLTNEHTLWSSLGESQIFLKSA